MNMVEGSMMKVTTVSLQLALTMKMRTMAAWVRERAMTLMFRQIWSETVVVSAASLLVMLPSINTTNLAFNMIDCH